jgi:outer membrane protein assembly factor BamB
MMTNHGLTGVAPETGEVLWDVPLPVPSSAPRSISPLPVSNNRVLVGSEGDFGVKLIEVTPAGKTTTTAEVWTSKALKPAFNDPVVADGSIYGFDGRIFACVDLATGTRRWKDGRYGEGQVILLAEQSLLLIVSESGEVVLLSANPGRHEELARFQALHGKAWSHPALVGRRLYLRNAEEMVCYQLWSPKVDKNVEPRGE